MKFNVPIQPYDDSLRVDICWAISTVLEREYKEHGTDYDPDVVGEMADAVIALFVSRLLGVEVTVAPQTVIGNGTLEIDPDFKDRPASKRKTT